MHYLCGLIVALALQVTPVSAAVIIGGLPASAPGVVAVPFTSLIPADEYPGSTMQSAGFTMTLRNAASGGGYVTNPGTSSSTLTSLDNIILSFGTSVYGWSATILGGGTTGFVLDGKWNIGSAATTVGEYSSSKDITGFSGRVTWPDASSPVISNLYIATAPIDAALLVAAPASAPVPEPATLALLASAVAAVAFAGRRKTS